MSNRQSFMYRTVEGLHFHVSEVEIVSSEQFKDEDGTLAALKGTAPAYPLFIKLNGEACAIDLDDEYNKVSAGIPLNTPYSGSYELSIPQKVERAFIETWGLIKNPQFGGYDIWKENAAKGYLG